MPPEEKSRCTVELLARASKLAYAIKGGEIDYERAPENSEAIAAHGYEVCDHTSPRSKGGTGKSQLHAVALKPSDDKSPIVIAYRGTATKQDVKEDVRLANGQVNKVFRDDAYAFYLKVQRENPGREIVLTGHSLGGHLAQYVGSKAYHTDGALRHDLTTHASPKLQVRTFNTAPIENKHGAVFRHHAMLENQFINYRLHKDVVSDLPLQKYYGNIYVHKAAPGRKFVSAHSIDSMLSDLPEETLAQTVGTGAKKSSYQNLLRETVQGFHSSYQSRVQGQYFSRFRVGRRNLRLLDKQLPQVINYLEQGQNQQAHKLLASIENAMKGKKSTRLFRKMRKMIAHVQTHEQINAVRTNIAVNEMHSKFEKQKAKYKTFLESKPAPKEGRTSQEVAAEDPSVIARK